MNEILVKSGVEIDLGKRGEHLARCIVFDISGWQKTYGDGSVHLLHQRNGDKAPYPCVVETDGTFVRWLLSETDVDVAGRGRAELQYFVDEARVKSETWNTRTNRSMNNEGPIPEEPAENWLNTMLQLGTETQENAEIAEQHAESAEQSAESAEQSAAEAKSSAQNAIDCENLVYEHAQDARAASENATAAMNAAEAAQTAAEQARDEAQAIAGGDVASTVYVNSQISAHNSNTAAHADIRQSIDALTAADVDAAPAGYGLGTKSVAVDDANEIDGAGFYSTKVNTPNGQVWYIDHQNYNANNAVQVAFSISTPGPGYVCIRYKYGGTWAAWAWANPPMELGVEYRTTERSEGKPVYAKRFQFTPTTFVGNEELKIPHNISNFGRPVRTNVRIGSNNFFLPYVNTVGGVAAVGLVNANNVQINTHGSVSFNSMAIVIDLYYTKTTD